MFIINGWKFDFKTMMAYRDKCVPTKTGRRITRDIKWDPMHGQDIVRISINYGMVFKYYPNEGPVESHFFDPSYYTIDFDSQIVKAHTDWQFEQQILLK